MKQIGLGIMMYVQDYDEKYPPAQVTITETPPGGWVNGFAQTGTIWTWHNNIYPYTKSMQVCLCPSKGGGDLLSGDYGVNSYIMPRNSGGISMAGVNSPSTTYLAMDAGQWYVSESTVTHPTGYNNYVPGMAPYTGSPTGFGSYDIHGWQLGDYQVGRHFDGINLTFADGHAKWLKSAEVYQQAKNYDVAGKTSAFDPYSN